MLTIAHQDILWILETEFLLLDEGPTDDINDSAAEYEKKKKKLLVLPYCAFTVSLNICSGCCNTLNDLSHEIRLPNITEVVNVKVLSVMQKKMIRNMRKIYLIWL